MAKMAGKFARFNAGLGAISGPFRWGGGFRVERLDITDFEAPVSASGNNIHTSGLTGPLDSTFTVEGWLDDANINLFFPDTALTCDYLFRKSVSLGYKGVLCDVLDFNPGTSVREVAKFTAQLQANGLVALAA